MSVRLHSPFQTNLGSADLQRRGHVQFDKVLGGLCFISITTVCPLADGTFGVPYGPVTLTAMNGAPPLVWSLAGGSLPSGMMLSAGGVISGTPVP